LISIPTVVTAPAYAPLAFSKRPCARIAAGGDAQIPAQTPILAVSLGLVLATGVAAASPARETGPGVIYAAFSILPRGKVTVKRCGPYAVRTATYTGASTSPDQRLAGTATMVLRIATDPRDPRTNLGFTRGTLRIRDRRRALRLTATVAGVNANQAMNGIVTGTLFGPNALLLANLTISFNENFTFGAVRLGLEDGRNSAVAYSPLSRRCLTR
jgi:hypothetical protein